MKRLLTCGLVGGGLIITSLVWKRPAPPIVSSFPVYLKAQKPVAQPLPPSSRSVPGADTHAESTPVIHVEESKPVQWNGFHGAGIPKLSPHDDANNPVETKAVSELANQGKASALAAFETFSWAVVNRETDLAAGLISFSWGLISFSDNSGAVNDAAQWTLYWIKILPEPLRSEVQTPQRLVALMHQNEFADYVAYSIVNREVLSAQTEIIRVRWHSAAGLSKEEQFIMRSTPSGWMRETHPFLLAGIARRLSGRP